MMKNYIFKICVPSVISCESVLVTMVFTIKSSYFETRSLNNKLTRSIFHGAIFMKFHRRAHFSYENTISY